MALFGKKNKAPEKLFYTTEIHCHIVPGIDDGSKNLETSVELVKRMQNWGIERIIATPHVTMDSFENTPETIAQAFNPLKETLIKEGVEMELSHSAEYRIDEFFIEQLEAGNITPFPKGYLLVENSFVQEPWNLDRFLFDLSMKGFTPILAHPERYTYYYDKSKRTRYDEMHTNGIFFQVNLLSLAGYYGKATKKIAEELLDKGYIDFLGSDLHNRAHADAIDAYLRSKDYQKHRRKLESTLRNDTAFV